MFRNRKRGASASHRPLEHACSARVDSSDTGLYFDASLAYEWRITDGSEERILHPEAVARSLLVGTVRAATKHYPVLHVREAEWSANEHLSREITTDERLTVVGRAELSLSVSTEAHARARFRAREKVHSEEEERAARLAVLQERLLPRGQGLLWWLERHGPVPEGADPKQWTRSLLESYEELTAALRRDRNVSEAEEGALLRARVEEALALVEDSEAAKRFAYYLGDYMTHVMGRSPKG